MAENIAGEIRKKLEEKKIIIGTENTIKNLKLGKIEKIYVTKNCPEDVKENINYYSKLGKAKLVNLKYTNEELGVICKKPFSISVASLIKCQKFSEK